MVFNMDIYTRCIDKSLEAIHMTLDLDRDMPDHLFTATHIALVNHAQLMRERQIRANQLPICGIE
jgi:hypothetical protein